MRIIFFLSSSSFSFPALLHLFLSLLFHSSVHQFSECNFSCALIKIKQPVFYFLVRVVRGYSTTLLSFWRYPFIRKIATCQNPRDPFSLSICSLPRSRVESLTTICSFPGNKISFWVECLSRHALLQSIRKMFKNTQGLLKILRDQTRWKKYFFFSSLKKLLKLSKIKDLFIEIEVLIKFEG